MSKMRWIAGILSALIGGAWAQDASPGCPACVVIQSQQRSDVEVGFSELTVPRGQLSWFTIASPNSEENRFRTALRTGITPRFDVGVAYSHFGGRTTLLLSYQLLRQSERVPFSLLGGYGFSSAYTRENEGAYLMGVRTEGNLALMLGWQHLRNGRDVGFLAGSYRLDRNTALMFYSHQGTMPGEPTLYNLALVRRVGDWNLGLWWFHPSRESDVGFALSRSFKLNW
jgi:hypothetical protein